MPFVQRNANGVITGVYANQQPGYAEEWLSDDSPDLIRESPEQGAAVERAWRDAELADLVGPRDRHRDQLELGVATTLTGEQFTELLAYVQVLRDWPQSVNFPDSSARPVQPTFLVNAGSEK